MTNINRLVMLNAAVALCGLVAGAQPVTAETREARGTIRAVTTTTMTIEVAGAQELTFFIDGDTHREVRFFEVGNPVLVRYDEKGGRHHAVNVERVGRAGKANPSGIAEGRVTSVSASHMTVTSGGHDMTFAITGDTDVMAKGASKAKKAAGRGTPLTTFVRTGDVVSVNYKQAAGAITASEIRVRASSRN